MTARTHTLHVVSHAHWDREWYQPFVGYQRRLVFLMDRLLDILEENEDFDSFYLDGQTCMLDDYLAVRPESEGKIRKYLQSGRLEMGPWYVMPDELLVSGEALIRNLEKGIRRCEEMGCQPVKQLHASDVFGHCSQMPQIMRGFGINKTMLLRGTSAESEKSEMLWEGVDGSRVWILKVFPDTGYCDIWTYRRETDSKTLIAYESRKVELSTTPVLIGLDGNDHQAPFEPILETIERMQSAFTQTEVIHSSMSKALQELDASLPSVGDTRPAFHGELRTPAKTGVWNEVFFGTASARIPTKQKNIEAQIWLTRIAEPLHAFASMNGGSPDCVFLEKAWEYLLKCHPHDSIVGCSTDQVDRDVHYRLEQAIELSRDGAGESLLCLGALLNGEQSNEADGTLVLFNPSTTFTGTVIPVEVEVPHDKSRKRPRSPAILDQSGNEVPSSLVLERRNSFPSPIGIRIEEGDYPRYGCRAHETGTVDRWKGHLQLKLDPLEIRGLRVRQGTSRRETLPKLVQVSEDPFRLENGSLRLVVNPDGTFDVTDKQSGNTYKRLGQFEHQFDKGNGWDFKPLDSTGDPSVPGMGLPVRYLKVKQDNEHNLIGEITISGQLRVPAGLSADKNKPLRKSIWIPFKHSLKLAGKDAHISIHTELENSAKDMRLRLLMPTQLPVNHWWGDSAFDMVKRPVALTDMDGWKEQVRPETPIHSWVAACHQNHGFSVITMGLQEACVLDIPERPIALTLLRCYRQAIGCGETEATQQQGLFAVDWHLAVFKPEKGIPSHDLLQLADQCLSPLQTLTIRSEEDLPKMSGIRNRISLEGNLHLSGLYFRDASLFLRIFNPADEVCHGSLTGLPEGIVAEEIDLKGSPLGNSAMVKNKRLDFELSPKQIQTWKVFHNSR